MFANLKLTILTFAIGLGVIAFFSQFDTTGYQKLVNDRAELLNEF